MALTQVFAAGSRPSATKLNESSIPVVSATSDIISPYVGQIIFNTTDLRLYRYNGSWITFTAGPTWALSRQTAQSIPNTTWTLINWDSEQTDTANMHSLVTNPFAVTISTPGLYAVAAKSAFAPVGAGTAIRGVRIYLNAANPIGSSILTPTGSSTFTTCAVTPTLYIQCALNDVLGVECFHNNGSALNTSTASSADYPLFTGTWLRD